jgi:Ca2+-binding RTX toxin-like protein
MTEISRLSRSYTVVAPAANNSAYKTLRDLGAPASPVITDLRQQANDIKSFGNGVMQTLESSNSIETARGLAESADLTRLVKDAVENAAQRINMASAFNNQRENAILKRNSGQTTGQAIVAMLAASKQEGGNGGDEFIDIFANMAAKAASALRRNPVDVRADDISGPRYGEKIIDRDYPATIGAGGGASVSVRRRALGDETLSLSVDIERLNSPKRSFVRAISDGSYRSDNDGWLIEGKASSGNVTAVYDTRDPLNEDERRSSITHNFGAGSDVLFVAGANDLLADGGAGDDILVAEGNSAIRGGEGNDIIGAQDAYGDQGDDILVATGFASGGTGRDTILLIRAEGDEESRLVASGGDDADLIVAQDEATAFGDAGQDRIILRAGGAASGGDGNDVITSFGFAEIDGGEGNDDIRIGASAEGLRVGGSVRGGAGADRVVAYGFTDTALGTGNDNAELKQGGVVRFKRGDGDDFVVMGNPEASGKFAPLPVNTAIFSDLMPSDVAINVLGTEITVTINGTTDKLTIRLEDIGNPIDLRFEKGASMQIIRVDTTLQTVGPVEPLTEYRNPFLVRI